MSVKFKDLTAAQKFAAVTLAIIILVVENWVYMIALGTLHSFFSFIPALGFWFITFYNMLFAAVLRWSVTRELARK